MLKDCTLLLSTIVNHMQINFNTIHYVMDDNMYLYYAAPYFEPCVISYSSKVVAPSNLSHLFCSEHLSLSLNN